MDEEQTQQSESSSDQSELTNIESPPKRRFDVRNKNLTPVVIAIGMPFWVIFLIFTVISLMIGGGPGGMALIALAPLFLIEFFLGIVFIVLLAIYVSSRKITKRQKTLGWIMLIIVASMYAYDLVISPILTSYLSRQVNEQTLRTEGISEAQAIKLIKQCKVESVGGGFQYGGKQDLAYIVVKDNPIPYSEDDGEYRYIQPSSLKKLEKEFDNMQDECWERYQETESVPITIVDERWLSADQAASILKRCQVSTVESQWEGVKPVHTRTPTGIYFLKVGADAEHGETQHIFMNEETKNTIIPMAREAKKRCSGKPQIIHKDSTE